MVIVVPIIKPSLYQSNLTLHSNGDGTSNTFKFIGPLPHIEFDTVNELIDKFE